MENWLSAYICGHGYVFTFGCSFNCAIDLFLHRESDSGVVEKFKVKWSVPVKDVDVVDAEIVTPYEVRMGPGRTTIVSPKLGK